MTFPIAAAIFSLMLLRLRSTHFTMGREIRSRISLSHSSVKPLSWRTTDRIAGRRATPSTSSLSAARLKRFYRKPESSIFSRASYSGVNLKSFFLLEDDEPFLGWRMSDALGSFSLSTASANDILSNYSWAILSAWVDLGSSMMLSSPKSLPSVVGISSLRPVSF